MITGLMLMKIPTRSKDCPKDQQKRSDVATRVTLEEIVEMHRLYARLAVMRR